MYIQYNVKIGTPRTYRKYTFACTLAKLHRSLSYRCQLGHLHTHTCKWYITLNPPVFTHNGDIPAFMCFSVVVFVFLFVSVFELTIVDTCTDITTYMYMYMYIHVHVSSHVQWWHSVSLSLPQPQCNPWSVCSLPSGNERRPPEWPSWLQIVQGQVGDDGGSLTDPALQDCQPWPA